MTDNFKVTDFNPLELRRDIRSILDEIEFDDESGVVDQRSRTWEEMDEMDQTPDSPPRSTTSSTIQDDQNSINIIDTIQTLRK